MSAPPIGMMTSTPSTNAIAVMMRNGGHFASGAATKNAIPKPIIARNISRLTICCPLNTIGALENSRNLLPRPASLPKAMTDPENVIAPMKVPRNSSMRLPAGIGSARLNAVGELTTAVAMSTAARPTSECIAATSSGICVISTRLAAYQPTRPPTTSAPSENQTFWVTAKVTRTAITMPTMPKRLPWRADSGCERPLSARMNRTLATR